MATCRHCGFEPDAHRVTADGVLSCVPLVQGSRSFVAGPTYVQLKARLAEAVSLLVPCKTCRKPATRGYPTAELGYFVYGCDEHRQGPDLDEDTDQEAHDLKQAALVRSLGGTDPGKPAVHATVKQSETTVRAEPITEEASPPPTFRPGIYRHCKGGMYRALALVAHHDTREPWVLYVGLKNGSMNIRPLKGDARNPDGWADWVGHQSTSPSGVRGRAWTEPRFVFVGDSIDGYEVTVGAPEKTAVQP